MTKSIWTSTFKLRPINKMALKVTKKGSQSLLGIKKTKTTNLPKSQKLDKCPYCSQELNGKLARHLTRSRECWRANKVKIKAIKNLGER